MSPRKCKRQRKKRPLALSSLRTIRDYSANEFATLPPFDFLPDLNHPPENYYFAECNQNPSLSAIRTDSPPPYFSISQRLCNPFAVESSQEVISFDEPSFQYADDLLSLIEEIRAEGGATRMGGHSECGSTYSCGSKNDSPISQVTVHTTRDGTLAPDLLPESDERTTLRTILKHLRDDSGISHSTTGFNDDHPFLLALSKEFTSGEKEAEAIEISLNEEAILDYDSDDEDDVQGKSNYIPHKLPDVVSSSQDLKDLIMAPHCPEKSLAFVATRIGPTLLLEGKHREVHRAHEKNLKSNFLYYCLALEPLPGDNDESKNRQVHSHDKSCIFPKALQWHLEDLNVLIGTDAPIFKDRETGLERIMLHLHNQSNSDKKTSKDGTKEGRSKLIQPVNNSSLISPFCIDDHKHKHAQLKFGAIGQEPCEYDIDGNYDTSDETLPPNDEPPLDKETALEFWLDNVMANVSSAAICHHTDGVVRGYQVLPTHSLPFLSATPFTPIAIQSSATKILKWLNQSTTSGTSYVIVKEQGCEELKLYNVTEMKQDGNRVAKILDTYRFSHPDQRRQKDSLSNSKINHVDEQSYNKELNSENALSKRPLLLECIDDDLSPGTCGRHRAILPFPGYSNLRVSQLAIEDRPSSTSNDVASRVYRAEAPLFFRQFQLPMATMCFRMAQCLNASDADALHLYLKVISLLSPEQEDGLVILAISHAQCMEYYYASSPFPDSERTAIVHCEAALDCLHALNHSVSTILLGKTTLPSQRMLLDLMDKAVEEGEEVGETVSQIRKICTQIVNCMATMARTQLRVGNCKANARHIGDEELKEVLSVRANETAVRLGRAVENILFAQEALVLRAHEVPSGLIMANPEVIASLTPMEHSDDVSNPQSYQENHHSHLSQCRRDVIACFELIETLSGDLYAQLLQTVLELNIGYEQILTKRSLQVSSNSKKDDADNPIEIFIGKLNRDVKVTLAVMNQRSYVSINLQVAPEHVNFVERLTPFLPDCIIAFDIASTFYQLAISHHSVLTRGRTPAYVTLRKKDAALQAMMAECHSRNFDMTSGRVNINYSGSYCTNIQQNTLAMHYYDRAANIFIECRDFTNAGRNLINASKMSLRLFTMPQQDICYDVNVIKTTLGPIHCALDFLSIVDRFSSPGHAERSKDFSEVLINARTIYYNALVFGYERHLSFYSSSDDLHTNVAKSCDTDLRLSVEVEKELHDRYLSVAFKIPKKIFEDSYEGANNTLRRAMEVKILNLMISHHWMCADPLNLTKSTNLGRSVSDRCTSATHAKHRLRKVWGYIGVPVNDINPLKMFQEACTTIIKMIQCEMVIITFTDSSCGANRYESVIGAVERSFTALSEVRPWLTLLENGQLDCFEQTPQKTTKKSRQKGVSNVDISISAENLSIIFDTIFDIPNLSIKLLACLFGEATARNSPSVSFTKTIRDAMKICLDNNSDFQRLSKNGCGEAHQRAFDSATAVKGTIDAAVGIFRGKRRKQTSL